MESGTLQRRHELLCTCKYIHAVTHVCCCPRPIFMSLGTNQVNFHSVFLSITRLEDPCVPKVCLQAWKVTLFKGSNNAARLYRLCHLNRSKNEGSLYMVIFQSSPDHVLGQNLHADITKAASFDKARRSSHTSIYGATRFPAQWADTGVTQLKVSE